MSFGRQESTTSSTTSQPFYYPGQEAYIPKFVAPMQDIYGGNFNNPTAQAMLKLSTAGANKAANTERANLAGATGLTSPARAKLASQVGDKAITGAAQVPGNMWNSALQVLSQYSLQSPVIGQQTVSSGGGGSKSGLCWVWTYFNGEHGADTEVVRAYRDRVYGKGSAVDLGYKRMGKTMLPLLQKSAILHVVFYLIVYRPITALARGSHNPITRVVAKVWEKVWRRMGTELAAREASQELTRPVPSVRSEEV
jgi:hypothetical protein